MKIKHRKIIGKYIKNTRHSDKLSIIRNDDILNQDNASKFLVINDEASRRDNRNRFVIFDDISRSS